MNDRLTSDRTRAVEPLQPDKSIGELFGELTADLGRLFRQEVQLAKTEASEEVERVGKDAGMLAAAGLGATLALMMLRSQSPGGSTRRWTAVLPSSWSR